MLPHYALAQVIMLLFGLAFGWPWWVILVPIWVALAHTLGLIVVFAIGAAAIMLMQHNQRHQWRK